MSVTIIVLIVFAVVFIAAIFLFPGKLEKDLQMEAGEQVIYTARGLEITRWPAVGPRQISYPGAKLTITNRKLIIAQKNLWGNTFTIREIMLNSSFTDHPLGNSSNWGNVLVSTLNYKTAFSIDGDKLILKNPNAENLRNYEIKGLPDNQQLIDLLN